MEITEQRVRTERRRKEPLWYRDYARERVNILFLWLFLFFRKKKKVGVGAIVGELMKRRMGFPLS